MKTLSNKLKMLLIRNVLLFVFLITLLMSQASMALSYVSFGPSYTDYNLGSPASLFFDDTANGYAVTFGFQSNLHWLSMDISLSDNGDSSNSVGPLTFELESRSIDVLANLHRRLASLGGNDIYGHLRVGFSATRFKGSELSTGLSNVSTDIAPAIGVGLALHLTPHWSIAVDYLKRMHEANIIPLLSSDVDMATYNVNAVYTF